MKTMIENTTSWAVLLPIRKQHAANIYAGTKTVELRKTAPPCETYLKIVVAFHCDS